MKYPYPTKNLVTVAYSHIYNVIKKMPLIELTNDETIEFPDYYFGDDLDEAKEAKIGIITTKYNLDINGFRAEATYLEYTFLRRINAKPMFPEVTFIIQGLDTDTTFASCAVVFIYGYLNISTWKIYGNLKEITDHVQRHSLYNNQNVFFQIHSVILGLQRVTTSKVIKLRADEIFLNFIPFVMKMYTSPNKLITTNIFIRPLKYFPYHCSDHIIGGSTKKIKEMFTNANLLIHNREDTKLPKLFNFHCWVPEQILTVGYLSSIYSLYYILEYNSAHLMNLHFDSIDLHSLCPEQIVYTKWDNDKNGVLRSEKTIVNSNNLHEHQNRIIDLHSYINLFDS